MFAIFHTPRCSVAFHRGMAFRLRHAESLREFGQSWQPAMGEKFFLPKLRILRSQFSGNGNVTFLVCGRENFDVCI